MNPQVLAIEDQTSPGTMSSKELSDITIALALQAHRDFNTSPWVEHGYRPPAIVMLLPKGASVPKGAWNIILMDISPEAGTLGFHEDEHGIEIPFSDVFVKTCREEGTPISECLSHEAWEMMVDPWVERPWIVQHGSKDYIVEVGDPVQGCGYDAGNGQIVADFVWPRWFGLQQTRPQLSQRQSIKVPFQLAPHGYISTKPVGSSQWTQAFGEARTELPNWASRLPRIHKGTI